MSVHIIISAKEVMFFASVHPSSRIMPKIKLDLNIDHAQTASFPP